ncbi:reverse transcriptase domain-containing protein [Tanacetum coccineum]
METIMTTLFRSYYEANYNDHEDPSDHINLATAVDINDVAETLDPVVKILSVAIVSPGIGSRKFGYKEWRKEQISKCQGSNVYVKNIDDDVTENELQECFSQCGTITSAKLMVNENTISKGFGFLCFSTPDMKQPKLLSLLMLRKDILNFQQLPAKSVYEAWERFKSCLRKCPDHRILLVDQIPTFYHGITMIDREKIMVAAGGNLMRKTPQEAYDLIENMTQHHYQWDSKVQYDTTTDMSAHYSKTTFALSEQIEVLGKQTAYTSQSVQHQLGPVHPNTFHYTYSDESDKDEPSKSKNSEINSLIREQSGTFLIGSKEIEFNPLKDINNLVPIPRVPEKPLDSLNYIFDHFDMTITNPLFDFDSEFTSNSDNPIFDIQNEDSDESEMETIMEEVKIHSSQSTAQFQPLYGKLTFDMTMHNPILTLS